MLHIFSAFQVRKVRISHNCKCPPPGYQVTRLQEGRYNIGGKIMFVRVSLQIFVWFGLIHYSAFSAAKAM